MKIKKIFRILDIYLQNISFVTIFIIFSMKFSLNLWMFLIYLKPFSGNSWNISHPWILFACKYWIYHDSLILSKLFTYLLFCFWISMYYMTCSISNFFSTAINKSLSANNSNLSLSTNLAMLIQVQIKSEHDQVHIFQHIYF